MFLPRRLFLLKYEDCVVNVITQCCPVSDQCQANVCGSLDPLMSATIKYFIKFWKSLVVGGNVTEYYSFVLFSCFNNDLESQSNTKLKSLIVSFKAQIIP